MSGLPRTALITGGASGIGAAFARLLARQGHHLWLVDRAEASLRAMTDELRGGSSVACRTSPTDLSNAAELHGLIQEVEAHPRIDVLVNCAGFGASTPFADMDYHELRDMVTVHDVATASLCRSVLPRMLARGSGSIINVSSLAAVGRPAGWHPLYGATKAFVAYFTLALQAELAPHGIAVQLLLPGYTRTRIHDAAGWSEEKIREVPPFEWMEAIDVAAYSLRSLSTSRALCIPHPLYRFLHAFGWSPPLQRVLGFALRRVLAPLSTWRERRRVPSG